MNDNMHEKTQSKKDNDTSQRKKQTRMSDCNRKNNNDIRKKMGGNILPLGDLKMYK